MLVTINNGSTNLNRNCIQIYLGKELCSLFKSNQIVVLRKDDTLIVREGLLSDKKSLTIHKYHVTYSTYNSFELIGEYEATIENDIIYLIKLN